MILADKSDKIMPIYLLLLVFKKVVYKQINRNVILLPIG